jgi:CRP-like cAMP-binding protein
MSTDKEQYNELIRWFIPINHFSPERQDEVVRIADILTFKKKEIIFKQGEKDDSSYYILKGEIELFSNNRAENTIKSGTDRARYPVAQLQPHHFSARAKTEVIILKLDRLALDRLMVLDAKRISDNLYGGNVEEIRDMEEVSSDWMTNMLQSPLFCRLPTENIYQLFTLLKTVQVSAGDTIIKQDKVADFYFIIWEGRCEITRIPSSGSKPIKLTELQSGDSFGEEALLTNAKHNASVTMLTDGVLMKLSKENFINLIEQPVIKAVSYHKARKLVATGASWLDVRFQNEHEASHIEDSINIPLNMLRMETGKLKSDKPYVIYCDTGVRSSAAAFLLTKRGYNVYYLEKWTDVFAAIRRFTGKHHA